MGVSEWTPEMLDGLKYAPCLFQQRVIGHDIRIHIVGDCAACEQIQSDRVDYRYASGNTHCNIELPLKIVRLLCDYMDKEGLRMIGADFKRDYISSELIILEVNTMPGYAGYDERSGGAISKGLIEELLKR